LKSKFPAVFDTSGGLKRGKVRLKEEKTKATIRTGKYNELRALWEAINQRVVLEYKIDNENQFLNIFKSFLNDINGQFKTQGSITEQKRLVFEQGVAEIYQEYKLESEILPISTLNYRQFIEELAISLGANMLTLHRAFIKLKDVLDINNYLSYQTIRTIKGAFHKHMLDNAFSKFQVGYLHVSNFVHPTALTDARGAPYKQIEAHALGGNFDEDAVPANQYLFEEVFYDSLLEKKNIQKTIRNVIVFTKIPRNSIRIPVAGGGTYSPDFAYVVEYDDGKKQLNLIIETKDKEKRDLFSDERKKIEHAELLFNSIGD